METRNSKLEVVNDVRLLIRDIYSLKFPSYELYGLQSQIRRAVVSVSLNLVEGNAFYDGHKIEHFKRAFGSLQEVEECFSIALMLELIQCSQQEELQTIELIEKCSKKIRRLIQSVSSFEFPVSSNRGA